MTPAQKIYAISWAKRLATPVVSCVQARLSPAHLLRGCSREDLEALVIVLAECADHRRVRAVTVAPGDEGMPPPSRQDVLRRANAEYARLCRAGLPVPYQIRVLNSEYRRVNRERRAAAGDDRQRQGAAA